MGRKFPDEMIVFGGGKSTSAGPRADWSRAATANGGMLQTVSTHLFITVYDTVRLSTKHDYAFPHQLNEKCSSNVKFSRFTLFHSFSINNVAVHHQVPLENWMCLCTQRNANVALDALRMMVQCGGQMGMPMKEPQVFRLANDRTEEYLKTIKDHLTEDVSACSHLKIYNLPLGHTKFEYLVYAAPSKLHLRVIYTPTNCSALWFTELWPTYEI